jgi:hypothetical protein
MLNKKVIYLLYFSLLSNFLFAAQYDEHWTHLLMLLFNRAYAKDSVEEKKVEVLREAVWLTLDSTLNNKRMNDALKVLKDFNVKDIPEPDTIVTSGNNYHQRYTHRGWDFMTYPVNLGGRNFQKVWELRKKILVNTVDKLFAFTSRDSKKKDSFAALLYYTHILGDHLEDGKITNPDRIQISGNRYDPTILSELEKHCDILFAEKNTYEYRFLKKYFESNKMKTVPHGQTMTDKELEDLRQFSNDILEVLFKNISKCLKEEDFFNKTFQNR